MSRKTGKSVISHPFIRRVNDRFSSLTHKENPATCFRIAGLYHWLQPMGSGSFSGSGVGSGTFSRYLDGIKPTMPVDLSST